MAVLCELKANQGEVMSQQALFSLVWPDRVFSPSSLQRVIAIIRKALNETSQNPTFLFTHPKLGYRLEVPDAPQKEVLPNLQDNSRKNSTTNLIIFGTILIVLLITFLFNGDYLFDNESSVNIKPITFGQQAEFNSKLSHNGDYVSYQSKSAPNSLFLSAVTSPSSVRQFEFDHSVVDYTWRTDSLLVLTQNAKSLFSLIQLPIDVQQPRKTIAEFSKWNKIYELTMGDNGFLWFIGQLKNENEHILVRHDLVSNSQQKLLELGSSIVNISITSSPHGLYFHYFNGSKYKFGLINLEHKVEYIDIHTPDIVDIHWHQQTESLLLSNQLTGELLALQGNKLELISAPGNEVLKDFSSYQNTLIATLTRKDMDIVYWQYDGITKPAHATLVTTKPISKKSVDTKFSDYQASYNNKQNIAFLSTRYGKPQVFIRNNHQTYLAFENHQNAAFIPPLIWSPLGEKLAFVVHNKIYIHNTKTRQTNSLDIKSDVERVMSWSLANSLIVRLTNTEYIEFDFITEQVNVIGFKNSDFIAKDPDGNWLGINTNELFWGDKRQPFEYKLRYAFYQDNFLIAHTQNDVNSKLEVFNSKLESIYSTNLDATCHHLTGINLSDLNNIAWLCTQLEADDSEVVFIENLHFKL
ncbi:winged helix-turn-helix domain-containing protein [Pseudoalteromonas xiamenensis]|nr:winged helix-turn-helix domain-containing protein [Pseudoalteromonas xiamenensis]